MSHYEQAVSEILDGAERTEPCRHGHFDCATVNGGTCSDELINQRIKELVSAAKQATKFVAKHSAEGDIFATRCLDRLNTAIARTEGVGA